MGLNSSGPISLGGSTVGQSVNLELGNAATAQISLGQSTVRSLAGVPSEAISLDNLHGKSSTFSFNLTSGSNLNLRTQALAAGWNGTSAVVATIPSGNTIQSASTGTAALTINGSFPAGVTLINNGAITGRGGNGGNGGNAASTPSPGSSGLSGGIGLLVSVAVTINNASGIVSGGGGGGGGGGGQYTVAKGVFYFGGGGGGGGAGVSSGGAGGTQSGGSAGSGNGTAGNPGTITTFGTGGAGAGPTSGAYGGTGGNGGALGSNGVVGGIGNKGSFPSGTSAAGGALGAAGSCTSGNVNITWIATGTRNGPLN